MTDDKTFNRAFGNFCFGGGIILLTIYGLESKGNLSNISWIVRFVFAILLLVWGSVIKAYND